MQFRILATLAFAASVLAGFAQVEQDVKSIDGNANDFKKACDAFQGSKQQANNIRLTGVAGIKLIGQGTADVKASLNFLVAQSDIIAHGFRTYYSTVAQSLDELVAKKDLFAKLNEIAEVHQDLQSQYDFTRTFQTSILNKTPAPRKEQIKAIGKIVDDAFGASITAFMA